jgi:Ran GTPase-activating protein (RanGAP) involved in mRNA processing and transport
MGWCKVGSGEGVQAVADMLMYNQTLRRLDLRGNGLGNDGEEAGAALGCTLRRTWHALQQPDMTAALLWRTLEGPSLSAAGSRPARVHPSASPAALILRYSVPGSPPLDNPCAGAIWFSRGFKEHTNEALRELELGYNEIKDEGACALAQARWAG